MDKKARHLEDLLDEGLRGTFPASDPVSVGRFTGTEPRGGSVDRGMVAATEGTRGDVPRRVDRNVPPRTERNGTV
jgi:hypothetical protein